MSIDKLKAAIESVNEVHVYREDSVGTKDKWDVDPKGDCEDYSFAVIWRYAGKSRLSFARNILFGPFTFWFVRVGPGEGNNGHFVTEYDDGTGDRMVFDNNWKRLVDINNTQPWYRYERRYARWTVLWKIIST